MRFRTGVAPVAPNPSLAAQSESKRRPESGSIYPWIVSIPFLALMVILIIGATMLEVKSGAMTEPVRYVGLWQFFIFYVGCLPIAVMAWFVSSMCDAAFNSTQPQPRAQTFNLVLAILVMTGHTCLVWSDVSPFMRRGGFAAMATFNYVVWAVGLAAGFLSLWLFHRIFKNLRISLVVRETPKGGPKRYMLRLIPRYGTAAFFQICILCFITTYTQAFDYTLNDHRRDIVLPGGICTRNINVTYMSAYCRPSQAGFQFVGHIDSPVHSGLPVMECEDGGLFPDAGSFKSLFDACENAVRNMQMGYILFLAFFSMVPFVVVLFLEFMTMIDDQMTAWNWITRARNWEANEKTSRGAAAWSGPRIIAAVVFVVVGALISLLCVIVLAVGMVLNYKPSEASIYLVMAIAQSAAGCGVAAFMLILFQLRHRKMYRFEVTPQQRRDQEQVRAEIEQEREEGVCGFWFVAASFVREYKGTTLPRFQDVSAHASGPLKFIRISRDDAYGQKALPGKYLAISHRWLEGSQPDRGGEQTRKLKSFLARPESQSIQWVWYE